VIVGAVVEWTGHRGQAQQRRGEHHRIVDARKARAGRSRLPCLKELA